MIRQIIVPDSNFYLPELPDELIGRQIEVLAFGLENESILAPAKEKQTPVNISKPSDIFKDCRVDLTNYKFDRDTANAYE